MPPLEETRLREQLESEGFSHTYVWWDAPGKSYPDHTHAGTTAHIILDGEITLTFKGQRQICRVGDRCDVPAGIVHSAQVGPRGCRYLIGER